jgi:hypothetical protein
MIRTRLIWFGVGFSVAGAAVSRLVWRDIGIDRYALFSDVSSRLSNKHIPSTFFFFYFKKDKNFCLFCFRFAFSFSL